MERERGKATRWLSNTHHPKVGKGGHLVGAGAGLSRVGFLEQGENKEEERATRRDFLIR